MFSGPEVRHHVGAIQQKASGMYEVRSSLRLVFILRENGEFSCWVEIVSANTCAGKLSRVVRQQINVPARSFVRKIRIVRVVNCVQTSVKTDTRYRSGWGWSSKSTHLVTRIQQGQTRDRSLPDSRSVG